MKRQVLGLAGLLLWLGLGAVAHAGTVYYDYTDPEGNVLAVADAQGHVVARYDYAPYGAPVASLGAPPNGPGYTGHVNDPETGLVYMQARYYQPNGRFVSPDPVGPSPGNIYSFNRYAYANNNPVVNTDPTGAMPNGTNDPRMSDWDGWGNQTFWRDDHCSVCLQTNSGSAQVTNLPAVNVTAQVPSSGGPIPSDAILYQAGNGQLFYAPQRANWVAVREAGYASGPDPIGVHAAIAHRGIYDFQRNNGKFSPIYTNSSNYAVGVFMNGAGFSLNQTVGIGKTYARLFSSNANDPAQAYWWVIGWTDANGNNLAKPYH